MLRGRTVGQVAGAFDQRFWTIDVLRATHVYPPIWHASLALAAIHGRMQVAAIAQTETSLSDTKQKDYAFALMQYNLAIKHLIPLTSRSNPNQFDQEALLLASLLFTGLCTMLGNTKEAISHAYNGLQLFYLWRYKEQPGRLPRPHCVLTPNSLIAAFTFLECQFINRLGYLHQANWAGQCTPFQCSALPFDCATDVYFEFQPLLTDIMALRRKANVSGRRVMGHIKALNLRQKQEFRSWAAKLQAFQQSPKHQQANKESTLLLQIFRLGLEISLCHDFGVPRIQFDKCNPLFKQIIDLSEQLCTEMMKKPNVQEYCLTRFSFSHSLCELLDFIGWTCRDGHLRRRLIALLKKWPQRDGILDPVTVALICEAGMFLEESGAFGGSAGAPSTCGCRSGIFICNDHRICSRSTTYHPDGEVDIIMTTSGDLQHQRPGTRVTLRRYSTDLK
ncbi:hypothetical protein QQS21_008843 [Conoideocrella luteorostrata]|uniref:C6 zinc finger domain protein n=1 Tax=Conoideocrella luteorostrata TaxID=1105319 RepID=A0AAJ0CIC9_9HYPO|nr:hypothetical protein QQS21_008843 [Conoideocrella luteorostrata]